MYAIKNFVIVSALVLAVTAPVVRAADTPEQARLREALRKQTAQGSTEAGIAPEDKPMTSPTSATTTGTPAVVAAPSSSTSDEALREALRQHTTNGGSMPLTAEEKALKTALRNVTSVPVSEQTVTTTSTPTTTETTTATSVQTQSSTTAAPATKEERLAELLRQYKADVITPGEYHKQRAEILAQ